ncbi:MAG: hypothetical protein RJA69_1840 [Pseudomonadota bacterium]|jgi:hypothetical protein
MSDLALRVGYLPGFAEEEVSWEALSLGSVAHPVQVQMPRLQAAQWTALVARVRQAAREQLKTLPVSTIIQAIDRAVLRWLDPNDPMRQRADHVMPRLTGWDAEMVRQGLNATFKTYRAMQLHRFVAEDLDNPKLLDEFQPRPSGGWARALGPDVLVHVWAGNVPGLPLWSLISSLLVKAGSVGKVARAEPLMAGWFAQTLAEVEPRLKDCMAVVWWPGGEVATEQQVLGLADHVLAYGSDATMAEVRSRVPVGTPLQLHGHKLSLGLVSRQALGVREAAQCARLAALDVVRHEQMGCYSPQAFYVERGGRVSPREWCDLLAVELSALQHRYPRPAPALSEALDVSTWIQSRAWSDPNRAYTVLGNEADQWRVLYTEQARELSPSALLRSVEVMAVDQLQQVPEFIEPRRAWLQTVGVATTPERLLGLAAMLGEVGVTRVCALGSMTAPQAGWHHDGRFSLLDLVRIVEVDSTALLHSDAFAPYRD